MSHLRFISRRDAIRYLVSGALAAACPASSRGDSNAAASPVQLGSESNTICHKVRDGLELRAPAPSAEHDIVIVGGGPSGLSAAYQLRHEDFLLLEKEPRAG